MPEVSKTGSNTIDIWPRVHGNQREQIVEMGYEKFAALLKQHQTRLGCITRYDLGPFGLQKEMKVAQNLAPRCWYAADAGAKGSRGLNSRPR